MKTFISLFVIVLIIAAALLLYIYSGYYYVGADKPEGKFTTWILETVMDNSVKNHAKEIKVPGNLLDPATIFNGFKHYDRMCGCHGNPNREGSKTFNPVPPEFAKTENEWKPNELFWIIKNGIKMSAMPTFKDHLSDDEIWETVAFVSKFPNVTPEEYNMFAKKRDQEMNNKKNGRNRRK